MSEQGVAPDPYSAIMSRRYVLQELDRHVEIFKRYHRPFALLMLVFENLDALNELFGDAGGDAVLQHAVTLMKTNLREIDIVCRHGVNEFAVIMPETDLPAAQAAGTRITRGVNTTSLKLEGNDVSLQVAFGASSCPQDGETAQLVLDTAAARATTS